MMDLNIKLKLRLTSSERFLGKPAYKKYHFSKSKYTVTNYDYESIVFKKTVNCYFLQDLGITYHRKFLYKCQITTTFNFFSVLRS